MPNIFNDLSSTLEDIEKRSQALLEKGVAARFLDKKRDSAEVARLVERLREAITHYQVSAETVRLRRVRLTQMGRYPNNKRFMIRSHTSP